MSTISPKINDIYLVLDNTYKFYTEKNALTANNMEGLGYQYIKLLMWSNMYRQLKYFKLNYFSFFKKMSATKRLIDSRFEWRKNTLIIKNEAFFINRFGNKYMKKIDNLGKGFFSTLYVLSLLIVRNSLKLLRKA